MAEQEEEFYAMIEALGEDAKKLKDAKVGDQRLNNNQSRN